MLTEWDKQSPDRVANVFRSMQNITSSHMLDTNLFNFNTMNTDPTIDDHEDELIF